MTDIVERLEGWALDLAVGRNCHGADQDISKAAGEIVRLRAERDRLRDALEAMQTSAHWWAAANTRVKGDTP